MPVTIIINGKEARLNLNAREEITASIMRHLPSLGKDFFVDITKKKKVKPIIIEKSLPEVAPPAKPEEQSKDIKSPAKHPCLDCEKIQNFLNQTKEQST